jgi:hypothetical protein
MNKKNEVLSMLCTARAELMALLRRFEAFWMAPAVGCHFARACVCASDFFCFELNAKMFLQLSPL